ncbi:MAG: hypothetical protein JXR53_00845 [Bacteroidales bacterium]|nr:hypothetical protein [Bacteroidales bacterium]
MSKKSLDIAKDLLPESSRALADKMAVITLGKLELKEIFLEVAFSADYPWNMRASNILEKADDLQKGFLSENLSFIVNNIPNATHDGTKRCLMKALSRYDLCTDDEICGKCAEFCFKFLKSGTEAIAVKYYALIILDQIIRAYPDLKHELYQTSMLQKDVIDKTLTVHFKKILNS